MLSMVWQVFVPGTQIVTLVCSMLRVRVGVLVTVMVCTFGVVDCTTVVESALGADAALALLAALAAAGTLAVPGALAVAGALACAGAAGAGVALSEPPPPPQAVKASAVTIRSVRCVRIGMRASNVIEYRRWIRQLEARSRAMRGH
jgi:hypothetical protein